MKRFGFIVAVAVFGILLFACQQQQTTNQGKVLSGTAEDLWGNKIDLSADSKGITLIEPFSPSNCGYCMLVGEFVDLNYFRVNAARRGRNFQQCLFNPQIDIYTYQKFYRDTGTVLTYPVSLHEFHRDGFPALLAFHDGEQILNGFIDDYGGTFKQRTGAWWPELDTPTVTLASGMKMAYNYSHEPDDRMIISVVPDGDTLPYESLRQEFASRAGFAVRMEHQLSAEDLVQSLEFVGVSQKFRFDCLRDRPLPFAFDSLNLQIGRYSFPRDQYALCAVAPNPYKHDKYISFKLHTSKCSLYGSQGWSDFLISRYDSVNRSIIPVLDGRFAKGPDNVWSFADSLSMAYENLKELCTGGVCPVPNARPYVHHQYELKTSSWENATDGQTMTLGTAKCRFPAVAVAPNGTSGVVWEEDGDIVLTLLRENAPAKLFMIEDGAPDAYNPRIVWDGQSFLIAYLSDRDGWYRVYARYLDGEKLSDEIRLSPSGTYDDISPALTSDGKGKVVAGWSEWKANFRFPKYCTVSQRTVGPVNDIKAIPGGGDMDDYFNAWYISLALSKSGRPVGVWNQHYPAILSICGGPLDGPASTPQKLTGNVETSECGEYPSTALDSQDNQWAAWATFSFDLANGEPQRILVSKFDSAAAWSAPYTVSSSSQTFQNQTPQLVIAEDGSMSVIYSGRPKNPNSQWGIYLSQFANGRWTEPVLLSEPGVCARAPQVASGPDNKLRVVWHEGIGVDMIVRVWRSI